MSIERKASGRSPFFCVVIAALGYFLTQMLSFYFPDADKVVMVIWPAAGVGLAAFLLLPRDRWPLLALAIFVAGNLANLIEGRNPLLSLGFMGVNLLESWLCALVILKMSGATPRLDRLVEVAALALAAVLVNALTSLPAVAIAVMVSGADPAESWQSWWISDGLGILIIAPFVLSWARLEAIGRWLRLPSIVEGVAFFMAWTAMSVATFDPVGRHPFAQAHPYLLILLILWPAYRFSSRMIGFSTLVLAFIAVTSETVALGPSPFGGLTAIERLQNIELFLAILTFAAYAFSAAFAELRAAREIAEKRLAEQKIVEKGLKESEERLRAVFAGAADGIIVADGQETFVELNEAARRILGIGDDEPRSMGLADLLNPEELRQLRAARPSGGDGIALTFNRALQRRDGARIELESRSRRLPSGETICVVNDVTERRFEKRLTEFKIRLLVTDTDVVLAELLEAALDEAEAVTGSSIGFFHLAGEDHQRLALTAWSKNTLATMCSTTAAKEH